MSCICCAWTTRLPYDRQNVGEVSWPSCMEHRRTPVRTGTSRRASDILSPLKWEICRSDHHATIFHTFSLPISQESKPSIPEGHTDSLFLTIKWIAIKERVVYARHWNLSNIVLVVGIIFSRTSGRNGVFGHHLLNYEHDSPGVWRHDAQFHLLATNHSKATTPPEG